MASSKEMGPNDADIVRCFVRTVGGLSSESALPYNAPFEIVVEVEAGSAIFGTGAQFAAGVVEETYQIVLAFQPPQLEPIRQTLVSAII